MRPRILKLSAFGSYSGETVIDFRKVSRGVFLITGDTGAGKTTIFDGITYALYGASSGGRREGSMMRSQYAKENEKTCVELEFESRGEIYRVCRNPEYQRTSKRKNKDGTYTLTKERAGVELYLPDGSLYPGKRQEIDQKLIEIVGVDGQQFSQIAMIAQGDFLKLLLARSDERKEIFARIFDTRIYRRVQELLRGQAKELYGKLEDNRKSICQEMERLEPESPEDQAQYQNLISSGQREPDLAAALELAGSLAEADQVIYKKLQQEESGMQQKLELLQKRLGLASQQRRLYEEWEAAEEEGKRLEAGQQEYERKRERLELGRKAGQVLAFQKAFQQASHHQTELQERIEKLETWLQLREVERQKQEADRDHWKMVWEQTEQSEIPKWQALLRSLEQYEKLEQAFQQAKENEKKWQAEQARTQEVKESYNKLAAEYEEIYTAYIREQAGILAADLKDGMACPVCGSTVHPKLAKLSSEAPTREQVDRMKRERNEAEKKKEKAQEVLLLLSEQAERDRTVLSQLETQLMEETSISFEQFAEAEETSSVITLSLEERENRCRQWFALARAKEETMRREIEEIREKKEESFRICEEARQEEQRCRGQLSENRELLRTAMEITQKEAENYHKAWSGQGFASEEAYLLAKLDEQELKILEQETEAYKTSFHRSNQRRVILAEQMKAQEIKEKPEISHLEEELTSARAERDDLTAKLQRRYSRRENHRAVRKQLKTLADMRLGLREQYERVNTLSRTANGTVTGTVKIDFESYVQRQYFRQMIHAANQHLQKMASGQFLLRCRSLEDLSTQGNAGLDLDVYSLITGKVRDVKTLSGGESFMAALALALGMTDLITRTSGAVQVDTLFIDEGFGSLDETSREQAIRILQGLSGGNRMVGIISHVTELKDQIDQQLVVTRTRQGSRAEWR